jgi:hypothetical protein
MVVLDIGPLRTARGALHPMLRRTIRYLLYTFDSQVHQRRRSTAAMHSCYRFVHALLIAF